MSNKDRNKRSARQARQRERAEREALVVESQSKDKVAKAAKSQSSKAAPSVKVSSANKNTGIVARTKGYFGDVRSEMRRVTWPGRAELTNYSVAVIAMLVVFGVVVWLVDTGVVAGLVGFTNLRNLLP
jgi:preprotein translocase subunit SecE